MSTNIRMYKLWNSMGAGRGQAAAALVTISKMFLGAPLAIHKLHTRRVSGQEGQGEKSACRSF